MSQLIARLLVALFSLGLILLALTFSVVALPFILLAAASVAGWFWWKTRALRRQIAAAMAAAQAASPAQDAGANSPPSSPGRTFDGEYRREARSAPHLPRTVDD